MLIKKWWGGRISQGASHWGGRECCEKHVCGREIESETTQQWNEMEWNETKQRLMLPLPSPNGSSSTPNLLQLQFADVAASAAASAAAAATADSLRRRAACGLQRRRAAAANCEPRLVVWVTQVISAVVDVAVAVAVAVTAQFTCNFCSAFAGRSHYRRLRSACVSYDTIFIFSACTKINLIVFHLLQECSALFLIVSHSLRLFVSLLGLRLKII